jgi:hypothetical protein
MEVEYEGEVEQLRRLAEERDVWWQANMSNNNLFVICITLLISTAIITIASHYFFYLLELNYIMLAVDIMALLIYGYSAIANGRREPMFICPKPELVFARQGGLQATSMRRSSRSAGIFCISRPAGDGPKAADAHNSLRTEARASLNVA